MDATEVSRRLKAKWWARERSVASCWPRRRRAYLVSGSHSAEVGHVGDGADREAAVDQAVVDEHVCHAEQRNPEALLEEDTWRVRSHSRMGPSLTPPCPTRHRLIEVGPTNQRTRQTQRETEDSLVRGLPRRSIGRARGRGGRSRRRGDRWPARRWWWRTRRWARRGPPAAGGATRACATGRRATAPGAPTAPRTPSRPARTGAQRNQPQFR